MLPGWITTAAIKHLNGQKAAVQVPGNAICCMGIICYHQIEKVAVLQSIFVAILQIILTNHPDTAETKPPFELNPLRFQEHDSYYPPHTSKNRSLLCCKH